MTQTNEQLMRSLNRLYARTSFGIKFGLETIEALLERMGHPEREFAAIHVAGTNGKGSVCAMVESILRAAGYKTGLYVSPHLVRFNERISVDGACITDDELAALFEEIEKHSQQVAASPGGREATFFEFTTALAFEHFRRKGVRLAVVETGMGGRLDATNTVMPLVSVITPISIEHTAYLGKDIESIALEKCGIIKSARPVVCGSMDEQALEVVRRVARERGAPLIESGESVCVKRVKQDLSGQQVSVESASNAYGSITIPLLGRHQMENCAMAVATIETIRDSAFLDIDPKAVRVGLSRLRWPARFQVISVEPPVILDGAHNPAAGKVLAATLKEVFKRQPLGLVVGMCNDKDVAGFLTPFAKMVKRCWTVPFKDERSLDPEQIALIGKRLGWNVAACNLETALDESREWALSSKGAVCIAGSLYVAGEVLSLMADSQ